MAVVIPSTVEGRRLLIEKELAKYSNTKHYCPAIGSYVKVLARSIAETATWGSTSVVGTKLCLEIGYVIHNAIVLETNVRPHSNKQIKKFKFVEMALLTCDVPGIGTAKLTIGYRKNGTAIEYCITEYSKK